MTERSRPNTPVSRRRAVDELVDTVLSSESFTDKSILDAAFSGGRLPPALDGFVEAVRRDSTRITDSDFARLRTLGYSEDDIFEIAVAAALGAGIGRLDAGLRAMATET